MKIKSNNNDDTNYSELTNNTIQNLDEQKINFEIKNSSFFLKLTNYWKNYFSAIVLNENRIIDLNFNTYPKLYNNNKINYKKYTIINLLPLFLFEQFNSIINIFYWFIILTQIIPDVRVGWFVTFWGPLSMVLTFSLIKELTDDYFRYKKEKVINNEMYEVLVENEVKFKKSKDLKVGDIIKISKSKRVPCDILVLWTINTNGNIFIRTDQWDGETDWKLKESLDISHTHFEKNKNFKDLDIKFNFEIPQPDLFKNDGYYLYKNKTKAVKFENMIWSNCTIASGELYGLVVYIGEETKTMQNNTKLKSKFSQIDKEINSYMKVLFILMLICCIILSIFNLLDNKNLYFTTILYKFWKSIILFSFMIPISLKITIEFARIFYIKFVTWNKEIEGTCIRNSNIPEELGRITFLLCDKTGTLTTNKMKLKYLIVENYTFKDNFKEIIKEIAVKDNKRLQFALECISLSHNVNVIKNEKYKNKFQGSSPDEISLLKFIKNLGYNLVLRNTEKIKFEFDTKLNKKFNSQEFKIKNIFPFSSETKIMGILIEYDNYMKFYLKGADDIMINLTSKKYTQLIQENCSMLSRKGLRTLVFSYKVIEKDDYYKIEKRYNINGKILNQNKFLKELIHFNKIWLDFACITGVEDKLQDSVRSTIYSINSAGIKTWMLTGDKLETAKCISLSTGFKNYSDNSLELDSFTNIDDIKNKLTNITPNSKIILYILGNVIENILNHTTLKKLFLKKCLIFQSIIIGRCAPKQKAFITMILKKHFKKGIASIGDGGNDVGMIRSSNIGFGIEGLEGQQAALSSDVSVIKFKYISELLLWHGRVNYSRSISIVIIVIIRSLLVSVCQFLFSMFYYYNDIIVFNGYSLLLYMTFFTSHYILSFVFDSSIPKYQVFNYPILYSLNRKSKILNKKLFCKILFQSIYQIFFAFIFLTQYMNIKNIKLILSVIFLSWNILLLLDSLLYISSVKIQIFICMILDFLTYIIVHLFFYDYLNLDQLNIYMVNLSLIIVLFTWIPFYLFDKIYLNIYPTEELKVKKESEKISKRKSELIRKEKKNLLN